MLVHALLSKFGCTTCESRSCERAAMTESRREKIVCCYDSCAIEKKNINRENVCMAIPIGNIVNKRKRVLTQQHGQRVSNGDILFIIIESENIVVDFECNEEIKFYFSNLLLSTNITSAWLCDLMNQEITLCNDCDRVTTTNEDTDEWIESF